MSGSNSAIAARSFASRTIRMSACCRSLFDGAESAHAHRSRSNVGIDRLIAIAPMRAMSRDARELVEAGEVRVDRESLAEALLKASSISRARCSDIASSYECVVMRPQYSAAAKSGERLCPAIHVLDDCFDDVDARHKAGHDE